MLQNSDQFSISDDVLVCSPTTGFGYQLASALGRLGKKVSGLISSKAEFESIRELPLRCIEFSLEAPLSWEKTDLSGNLFVIRNFVLSFNEALSKNEAPSAALVAAGLNLAQGLLAKHPNLHLTIVLPERSSASTIEMLRSTSPQSTTIFLTPALYGLRDHFVLDHLFSMPESDIARLTTPFAAPCDFPMTFVADVVAFVISTLGQERLKGKIVRVPPCTENPEELGRAFARVHNFYHPSPSLYASIRSYLLRANPLETFLKARAPVSEKNPFNSSHTSALPSENTSSFLNSNTVVQAPTASPKIEELKFEAALDLFPSHITQVERALKMSFKSRMRFPELNSHFPPSRSP